MKENTQYQNVNKSMHCDMVNVNSMYKKFQTETCISQSKITQNKQNR